MPAFLYLSPISSTYPVTFPGKQYQSKLHCRYVTRINEIGGINAVDEPMLTEAHM
jgi:hypothetical protein